VIKSIKVNEKNESQARQKAKVEVEEGGSFDTSMVGSGAVDSVEFINAYNNNVDFNDIIDESSMKPVVPAMQ